MKNINLLLTKHTLLSGRFVVVLLLQNRFFVCSSVCPCLSVSFYVHDLSRPCLSVCLSVCRPVCLPLCLSVFLFACVPVYLTVSLSMYNDTSEIF